MGSLLTLSSLAPIRSEALLLHLTRRAARRSGHTPTDRWSATRREDREPGAAGGGDDDEGKRPRDVVVVEDVIGRVPAGRQKPPAIDDTDAAATIVRALKPIPPCSLSQAV